MGYSPLALMNHFANALTALILESGVFRRRFAGKDKACIMQEWCRMNMDLLAGSASCLVAHYSRYHRSRASFGLDGW